MKEEKENENSDGKMKWEREGDDRGWRERDEIKWLGKKTKGK